MRLVRRDEPSAILWNPYSRTVDRSQLEDLDAVIHLSGRSIAGGKWTTSAKKDIYESRILPTRFLAETLAKLKHPPKVFMCASAVGYYGDRGDELLAETSGPGEGFLPKLCTDWEQACEPARECGIRTINVRIGLVLSSKGGALGPMLLPFKFGLGGQFGSGRQYLSWISLADLISMFEFTLAHDTITGPINGVSLEPITNREFTRTLGQVLRRPTFCTLPAFAVKLLLGEMGNALLLSSARVVPDGLLKAGFTFQDTNLEKTLRLLLGQSEE